MLGRDGGAAAVCLAGEPGFAAPDQQRRVECSTVVDEIT